MFSITIIVTSLIPIFHATHEFSDLTAEVAHSKLSSKEIRRFGLYIEKKDTDLIKICRNFILDASGEDPVSVERAVRVPLTIAYEWIQNRRKVDVFALKCITNDIIYKFTEAGYDQAVEIGQRIQSESEGVIAAYALTKLIKKDYDIWNPLNLGGPDYWMSICRSIVSHFYGFGSDVTRASRAVRILKKKLNEERKIQTLKCYMHGSELFHEFRGSNSNENKVYELSLKSDYVKCTRIAIVNGLRSVLQMQDYSNLWRENSDYYRHANDTNSVNNSFYDEDTFLDNL